MVADNNSALPLEGEEKITLSQARELMPGKRSTESMWRYCRRGIRGIRLEHIWSGRAILTSGEAVVRFIRATNEAAAQEAVGGFEPATTPEKRHSRSAKQRDREHENARRRLASERI